MHVLIIPDGIRRFAANNSINLETCYKNAGELLGNVVLSLLKLEEITELSVYPLALYNLKRIPYETNGLKAGIKEFLETINISKITETYSVDIIGEQDVLMSFIPELSHLILDIKKKNNIALKKKLHLFLAYDSVNSWPPDFKNWIPFSESINLIIRFGQPSNLIRGSGIFPMSDQAYWHPIEKLFQCFSSHEISIITKELILKVKYL